MLFIYPSSICFRLKMGAKFAKFLNNSKEFKEMFCESERNIISKNKKIYIHRKTVNLLSFSALFSRKLQFCKIKSSINTISKIFQTFFIIILIKVRIFTWAIVSNKNGII